MYFPVEKTLGYSHGLVLYAPFYIASRLFSHPFRAHTVTLFAVMEVGIVCLYLLLRKLRLSFGEALLLTAFFFTSPNVVGWETGVWSQRASVFLIPPILLLLLISRSSPARRALVLAGFGGFLSTLLYVQDFYTAHFAFLFAGVFAVAAAAEPIRWRALLRGSWPWLAAVMAGALAGAGIFFWIYVGAYLEHRAFPDSQVLNALTVGEPSRWRALTDVIDGLGAYRTMRPFTLAFVAGLLACLPRLGPGGRTRLQASWFVAVSLAVLLIPLRLGEFSIWLSVFQRLPGFDVIRDPKRIIQIFELAVVLATAVLLSRARDEIGLRLAVSVVVVTGLVAHRNPDMFGYERTIAVYQRWVGAPVRIDPACKCFYIKGASPDFMSRSGHMWSLYGMDALFVALEHGIPTLNGYSAWVPESWDLANPQEAPYQANVERWVRTNGLTGVCEFDVHARTMTLRFP
jgi:hypothetical protein